MDTLTNPAIQAEIDRELRLVDSAIAMVRRGVALRVTVVNLPMGAAILAAARARGQLHGVCVAPVGSNSGVPCALVVGAGPDEERTS